MSILDNAAQSLERYNSRCIHYNLIAQGVYRAREEIDDPLSLKFRPYIVAGLIGFDMLRTMGKDPYSCSSERFQGRLSKCLDALQDSFPGFANTNLANADLSGMRGAIETAYGRIVKGCTPEKDFHVGTTKVLHWLFPDLFIILDRNAAAAFREHHGVDLKRTTQPGYSSEKYFECLEKAQEEIKTFGIDRFRALESGTPLARIFDKIAFVVGEAALKS